MAQNTNGSAWIMASIVLGIAIVGSSYLLASALDRSAARLSSAIAGLQQMDVPSGAAPSAAANAGKPDPAKVYAVEVGPSPFKGSASAQVTIVEFSDFQCPFCGRVNPTLAQIEKEYGDQVRIAFKHMPLSFHQQAGPAHAAAEAAHRQGKFWEMHDKIFANQKELTTAAFERYASELGLDVEQFKKDAASAEVKARISADQALARELGVTGTPGFFVNGRFLSGAQPFPSFKKLIDEALQKKS